MYFQTCFITCVTGLVFCALLHYFAGRNVTTFEDIITFVTFLGDIHFDGSCHICKIHSPTFGLHIRDEAPYWYTHCSSESWISPGSFFGRGKSISGGSLSRQIPRPELWRMIKIQGNHTVNSFLIMSSIKHFCILMNYCRSYN
jgi:hypothetical protein